MAYSKKKKNRKRFECLKKKAEELSILCDVEVLFLCKEDDDPSSNSFESWPEDRNSCLSLIDKYKNSSVPAKPYNKKTVLGKRKEMSDTQVEDFPKKMEDLSGIVQENVEFEVAFVDSVDFDDFYAKYCESVQESQSKNVQENGEFEVASVDFDDFYGKYCESVQESRGKNVQENEEFEVASVDFDDFFGKFCESVEEFQSKNAQEKVEIEMGFVDDVDFDDFLGKFCEPGEETQMVLCDNVKDFDNFELGFSGDLEFDENCVSFCELIQERENVHELDKLDLGLFEGPGFGDENSKLVEESEKSDIVMCENVKEIDAIINVFGHQQLLQVLTCLDEMLDRAQRQNC